MKITLRADKAYKEVIDITKHITEKRKLGWLFLDKNGDLENSEFVYSTPFNEKCIAFQYSKGSWGSILDYGKCHNYGESSFLKECLAAKKELKKYKLLEPLKIHKL